MALARVARLVAANARPARAPVFALRAPTSAPMIRAFSTSQSTATPASYFVKFAKWTFILTGVFMWAEVTASAIYDHFFGVNEPSSEQELVQRYYDVSDIGSENFERKELALAEFVEKLRQDAGVQAYLGGEFFVWNNVALPGNAPAPGLQATIRGMVLVYQEFMCSEGQESWFPSIFLVSDKGFLMVNTCFMRNGSSDEWVPTAARVYPLSEGPDMVNVRGNLPHGLKYFARLS